MLRWLALLTCVGCGRIAFDPTSDARGEPCTFGRFSAPVKLDAEVQSADTDDWFPTPSVGATQLYFHSYRAPSAGGDLWVATRATTGSPFSTPELVASLNSGANELAPSLTEDGLEIAFVVIPTTGTAELFTSTRSSPTGPWNSQVPLATLNSIDTDTTPYISSDGLRFWFASDRPASQIFLNLFEVTRSLRT